MSVENTHHTPAEIAVSLMGKTKLWFIGIGGIHMCALALISRARGFLVAGSDHAENENTARLRRAGVAVYPQHNASQMAEFDAVIYTLAITPDNPEYLAAKRLGLPVFSRADYLGYLMHSYPTRIGIAGSHGKSTTTAMLGEIFDVAGRSPNVVCGAVMQRFGAPFVAGGGNDFIFEACEYGNSFLRLPPTLAVILNAELDHVDFFTDKAMLLRAFGTFASSAQKAILPSDDAALHAALPDIIGRITFGIESGADYRAEALAENAGFFSFDLILPRGAAGRVTLGVAGVHNVKNALAAAAAADLSGVNAADILVGLAGFRGARRRMEYRGIFCGARVFDDYAHHPTEIAATLKTARDMAAGGRVFAVFQSHTYSRTAAFFGEICTALAEADRVIVADIYPARETDTLGMSAAGIAAGVGAHAAYVGGLSDITATLVRELAPGDLVVVMGAGDIDRIFGEFSKKHFTL
ncbi:MAG: UDP-N-acetylmuramate--L-alanine ligase [Clostridia bacterium]|nr:UDP-N-acetylmuramate--L-alanine ligase [Clostridia bacterium]